MHFNLFHRLLTIISWLFLFVSLVYIIIIWPTIPQEIGIHFGPSGEFDMYDSKTYAFYPYGVGFGLLLIFEGLCLVARKVKSGMNITPEGEHVFRKVVTLLIDIGKLCTSTFFTYWSICVIRQTALRVIVPQITVVILALSFIGTFIVTLLIKNKYNT